MSETQAKLPSQTMDFKRASYLTTLLVFKGINHFCERDIQAAQKCVTFYEEASRDGKLQRAQCAKEKGMVSICRLYAAESISVSCKDDVARLREAIGTNKPDTEITTLTNALYKCGLTPTPLYSGQRNELPAGMIDALKKSMLEEQQNATFHAVLAKQIQDRADSQEAVQQQQNDQQ